VRARGRFFAAASGWRACCALFLLLHTQCLPVPYLFLCNYCLCASLPPIALEALFPVYLHFVCILRLHAITTCLHAYTISLYRSWMGWRGRMRADVALAANCHGYFSSSTYLPLVPYSFTSCAAVLRGLPCHHALPSYLYYASLPAGRYLFRHFACLCAATLLPCHCTCWRQTPPPLPASPFPLTTCAKTDAFSLPVPSPALTTSRLRTLPTCYISLYYRTLHITTACPCLLPALLSILRRFCDILVSVPWLLWFCLLGSGPGHACAYGRTCSVQQNGRPPGWLLPGWCGTAFGAWFVGVAPASREGI